MNANSIKKNMKFSRLAWFIALQCMLPISHSAMARDYFNPALLGIDGPGKELTDLSAFEEGIGQLPGTYRVDVIVNKTSVGVRNIDFVTHKNAQGESTLQPCLSIDMLREFGIRTEAFPRLAANGDCANLSAIPQASAEFAFERQQLLFSIPQAAIDNLARGYIAPERLDAGINALLLNYSFTGADTQARTNDMSDYESYYLSLQPGLNIGSWRIRNYSTWNRDVNDGNAQESWDSLYTYAQHDVISLKGQLTLGDSTAPSDMFDSVPFRGIQLASDDDMLPDSLRGYAPVVRGIARTNAQVVIKQNGYTIYQSYVSPGAFEITDMYPTGSSGDLDVTIKEADGSEQHQTVAFASLPVLQREGRLKYNLTSGQYRPYDSDIDKEMFTQASVIYGLPDGFTVYGGGQFLQHYQSLLSGFGKNFGTLGAVSLDGTQAWSTQKDQDKEGGQSWRIRYSKNILATGTNISISGYRYSTSGYYTLQEVLDTWRDDEWRTNNHRRRNRAEFQLNQNIGESLGSLSLNAISEDYWNSDRQMQSIGVGYSNNWAGISWNLNYSYNRNTTDNSSSSRNYEHEKIYNEDQVFSLSMNIPLDRWLSNSYANYDFNTSKKGDTSHTVGLSGSALEERNLNWNVQESETNHGEGSGGYASLDYQGTYARLNSAYSYDHDQKRVSYGIEGGMVAHAHGITLSQALGETAVLVEAPGTEGVAINNQNGVKTDFRGYTVVPYVSPYRESTISLNTETLPEDADIELTTQTITPTRGAIVRAHFDTRIGKRVLMTLVRSNGENVPFGAMVTDSSTPNTSGSIVGDGGIVYLTGMKDAGTVTAKWGRGTNEQCQAQWQLPNSAPTSNIIVVKANCR